MVVLIAYATRYGATRSIAGRIAARLREYGHQVVLHATDRPIDAAMYDAVVVGSSVYDQAWLPAAQDFVRQNLDALAGRPVWMFSVGALRNPGRWARIGARTYPQKIRGVRGYVEARDYHYFSGEFYRERIGRVGAVLWRLCGGRFGDFRNWSDVDAWAHGIASALAQMASSSYTPVRS
jgi:menaquinone-dependent protoporphyrinogen oxidase